MDRVAMKLEQDLVPMDEGNGEKQVKLRWMNQYDHVMSHDMKWIISLLIVLVHVLHQHWRRWNRMRKAKV